MNAKWLRWIGILVALLAVSIGLIMPLVLHLGQLGHNRLEYNVDLAFPIDKEVPKGEPLATTLVELMEHELNGWTGWRPNDLFPLNPEWTADNNYNRQLGILKAVRVTTQGFQQHLTKFRGGEQDRNLLAADNAFRIDPRSWMFPSAETSYEEGIGNLRAYIAGLKNGGSFKITGRHSELIQLLNMWKTLLDDVHKHMMAPDMNWFERDDHLYQAQGTAYALAHLTAALRREYAPEIASRAAIRDLFDAMVESLQRIQEFKPVFVFSGSDDGWVLINHGLNLVTFTDDANRVMEDLIEELQK